MSNPKDLYYIMRGDMKVGFIRDTMGNPYLPGYLSYRGSGNLIDSTGDLGREFQSCLLLGNIYHGTSRNFDFDTINPTLGGGNYGRAIPTCTECEVKGNTLTVTLPALEYMPKPSNWNRVGPYKARLEGTYPLTGWIVTVKYTVTAHSLLMECAYQIVDRVSHKLYYFRPAVLHLNPEYFQYPLDNESKRDPQSWLSAIIKDDYISVTSTDKKLKAKLTAGIYPHPQLSNFAPEFHHRCFKESNRTVQNTDGTADVWEAIYQLELYNGLWISYQKDHIIRGWAKIDLQPKFLKFDLAQMIKNLFAAVRKRKEEKEMSTIVCNDGTYQVTDDQRKWLLDNGYTSDMSSYPQAGGDRYSDTVSELQEVLRDHYDPYHPPVDPTPDPVEPPPAVTPGPPMVDYPGFEDRILSKLDRIIDLLEDIEIQGGLK